MIIRLTVQNFLSFNHETELLLTPGPAVNLRNHIIEGSKTRDPKILKSAIIYGANASGKSNLIKAVHFIKRMVTRHNSKIDGIQYEHFKLSDTASIKPSKLELEFKYKGTNYAYGFDFNKNEILNEWLYKINKQQQWMLFERKTKNGNVIVNFDNLKLAKNDKLRLEFIGKDTLPNQLFLNAANTRNIANIAGSFLLRQAFEWFDEELVVIFPDSKYNGLESGVHSNETMKNIFQSFLQKFDTGISGLETKSVDFFSSEVNLPERLKQGISSNLKKGESALFSTLDNIRYAVNKDKEGIISAVKLLTVHKNIDTGEYVLFEVNEESDGTQRIMDFIPAIMDLLAEDKVYLIDEIDRSLHPNLTRKLFEVFFELSFGKSSQLIATTHEDYLLENNLFRQDEIWFVDKNKNGESSLRSLLEYRIRKETDIKTGYLKGRFEAIPSFPSFANLEFVK